MAQSTSASGNQPLIELKHVDKHYGDLHALNDINLSVDRGEVVVVIGPSGSGKSTMCRTINRLETINEVLEVMVRLAQQGMTMIVITHEMNFARRVADRVVFMADGQIVETGTPDEFFDHPQTKRAQDFLNSIKGH